MTESNEPLTVNVELTESDLQRANFWFGLRNWSNRLMLAVMPIAGLLLLWKVQFSTIFQQPLVATGVVVLLGFPVFYFAMIWLRTKRGFGSLQGFQTKIEYSFSPSGYELRDMKSSAKIDWDTISRAAESEHSFHLFFHSSAFHTIPKRCFKHTEDIGRLRTLLKQTLGTKAAVF
ncbi:MAG TPA: YcxB family protein [Pyrinomonadaceae bacterium]|nr:YcxB family protein [Pyrinomonadaceae bacterium]